jgi:hypothetical protein
MPPGFEFLTGVSVLTIIIVLASCLFTLVIAVASVAIPIVIMRANRKKAETLMATGTPGEATVISLQDTGMRINDNPRVTLVLAVRIPNYAPYQIAKTVTIPLINLSQVQPGAVVQVVADPNDPGNPNKLGVLLR